MRINNMREQTVSVEPKRLDTVPSVTFLYFQWWEVPYFEMLNCSRSIISTSSSSPITKKKKKKLTSSNCSYGLFDFSVSFATWENEHKF